jgi:hypothetical protein
MGIMGIMGIACPDTLEDALDLRWRRQHQEIGERNHYRCCSQPQITAFPARK